MTKYNNHIQISVYHGKIIPYELDQTILWKKYQKGTYKNAKGIFFGSMIEKLFYQQF